MSAKHLYCAIEQFMNKASLVFMREKIIQKNIRNQRIRNLYDSGVTLDEIGQIYDISPQHVKHIYREEASKEKRKSEDELYGFLYNDEDAVVNRAINCLKRNGISTVEQLLCECPYIINGQRKMKTLGEGSIQLIRNAVNAYYSKLYEHIAEEFEKVVRKVCYIDEKTMKYSYHGEGCSLNAVSAETIYKLVQLNLIKLKDIGNKKYFIFTELGIAYMQFKYNVTLNLKSNIGYTMIIEAETEKTSYEINCAGFVYAVNKELSKENEYFFKEGVLAERNRIWNCLMKALPADALIKVQSAEIFNA